MVLRRNASDRKALREDIALRYLRQRRSLALGAAGATGARTLALVGKAGVTRTRDTWRPDV
jgi:hypothetical protein